ncbi:MAG: hypothetical protein MUC50_15415 [Myxococcota bacterium]|nr:hypothetical protein [Myxococcota bacterium]
MEDQPYRLAQYEIIQKSSGEICWKSHGGFAAAKKGKCFVEGDILFIGPSEAEETGFLKNEFLEYLRQLPQWEKTKLYCPSFTLRACKGGRAQHAGQENTRKEIVEHDRRESSNKSACDQPSFFAVSPTWQVRQARTKLGEIFQRCKGLVGADSQREDTPEE